ncbi:hypothetical protein DRN86_00040 [Candidatus Geothermarchaeota archaeon]|nr:MAG: hypothetical protein DRN86_00040 [Candidatus Geothermarchaeota archaeon]
MGEKMSELAKAYRKGIILLILDKMKKTARYWEFAFSELVEAGLHVPYYTGIRFKGNEIILTIRVKVPDEFIQSLLKEEALNGDKEIEESGEDIEVELVERDKDSSS